MNEGGIMDINEGVKKIWKEEITEGMKEGRNKERRWLYNVRILFIRIV